MILDELKNTIVETVKNKFEIEIDQTKLSLSAAPLHIEADISFSWALQASKILKRPPSEIAKIISDDLEKNKIVTSAGVSSPGFVNIKLNEKYILNDLNELVSNPDKYNKPEKPVKEKILIEFVSANPTGPLHIASGRGASIGASLVNIFNELGMPAYSEYYVNDAGNQAHLLGLSLKARHKGKDIPEEGYHGHYLADMAKELPANTELSEKEYSDLAITQILKGHKKDMSDFGVNFDKWFLESNLYKDNSVSKTLDLLKKTGNAYEKDDAVWFGLDTKEDDKDRVLVRKDKRPTYFLSDLAYHKSKYERGFDTLIDVWGADHHGYKPRMEEGLKALNFKPDAFKVIFHQFVHIKTEGKVVQMSKRTGNFKTLSDLIKEVGKDACRFFFALASPTVHMTFDTDLAKQKTKDNPVYYVQYVYARINSIFEAANEKGINCKSTPITNIKLTEAERNLTVKLMWFNNTLKTCVENLSPHHLAVYLIELAKCFHAFYEKCKVLDENNTELSAQRLFLCKSAQTVIQKGLYMLGVGAPEKM